MPLAKQTQLNKKNPAADKRLSIERKAVA